MMTNGYAQPPHDGGDDIDLRTDGVAYGAKFFLNARRNEQTAR